ncbi:hypothetical protein LIER_38070 [Lithospermum erythrorhizon]|uniref:Uncharacterized protein n=1 Tax=Lithospermum erythrorhizon TaxID=34254 RepID=A0AAV3PWR2_LITER
MILFRVIALLAYTLGIILKSARKERFNFKPRLFLLTATRVLDELPQPTQRKNKHGKKVASSQVWKEKNGFGVLNSQRQTAGSKGKDLQIDNSASSSVSACTDGQTEDMADLVNVEGQSSHDFQVPGQGVSAKSFMVDVGSSADMLQVVAQPGDFLAHPSDLDGIAAVSECKDRTLRV